MLKPPSTVAFLLLMISNELVQAYYNTDYLVFDGDNTIILTLDQFSEPLASLLQRHHATTAAFISACNPQSVPHPTDANMLRHRHFKRRLQEESHIVYEALGRARNDSWEEASVLVLNIDHTRAVHWGRYLEQLAIVWIASDAIPTLQFCSA